MRTAVLKGKNDFLYVVPPGMTMVMAGEGRVWMLCFGGDIEDAHELDMIIGEARKELDAAFVGGVEKVDSRNHSASCATSQAGTDGG